MAERMDGLWREILEDIAEANKGVLDPYIQQVEPKLLGEHTLQITVTTEWAQRSLERKGHLNTIRESLRRRHPGEPWEVRFAVDAANPAFKTQRLEDFDEGPTELAPEHPHREIRPRIVPQTEDRFGGLNPKYTFTRFMVGSSNRLAFAAAMRVSESPDGSVINPLFIHGGVGLGKTHLLHAIGNLAREKQPHLKTLYVSAETFTNDMVDAIRQSETNVLRNKYRTADILLMDDIQFLQKKGQSQIEFFHTFNDLYNANKQIVLTSDTFPRDIPELEERLRSRFMGGMTVSVDLPEVETRIAILQRKAEEVGIGLLPDGVAAYIAERVITNIRELEGTLSTVYRHATLLGREVDMQFVREVLKGEEDEPERTEYVSVETIQRAVAEFFQMKPGELKSKKRTKMLANTRHIAMYLCRHMTHLSLVDIGRDFGGRDHTTVLSALQKIEKEVERDPELRQIMEQITQRIRGKSAGRR